MRPRSTALAVAGLLVLVPAAAALGTSLYAVRVPDDGTAPGAGGVLGLTGRGVVVAVLDTGVDNAHPSLAGSFVAGAEVRLGVGSTYTVVEGDPSDANGHGTHVANIALGRGLADGRLRGVAPEARLVDVKIANDLTGFSIGGLDTGLRWVLRYNRGETGYGEPGPDRVRVVSISFASATAGSDSGTTADLVRELRDSGVVVVAAAGNCGPSGPPSCRGSTDTITSPGSASAAVTVAAVDDRRTRDGADDRVATFSSRGPNGASTLPDPKPNVAAPGANITSAWRSGGQRVENGTSQATPHVAGVVALMLEANPALAPGDVKRLLQESARDVGPAGWDKETGHGVVDAYAAARAAQGGNAGPVAVARASAPHVEAGGWMVFSANGSHDPDGLLLAYAWDVSGVGAFPDRVVRVRLPTPGDVEARLTVTDADGATANASVVVRVVGPGESPPPPPPPPDEDAGPPPVARFFADPSAAVVGELVRFDASGSTGGRPLVRWSWTFAGAASPGEGRVVERAFGSAGTVLVNLTVKDDLGRAATREAVLVVSPPPRDDTPPDVDPPLVRILRPIPGARLDGPVVVEWEAEDESGLLSVTLVVDALARTVPAFGARELDLGSGAHEVRVEAVDVAGNSAFDQVAFLVVRPLEEPGDVVDVDPPPPEAPAAGVLLIVAGAAAVARLRRRP